MVKSMYSQPHRFYPLYLPIQVNAWISCNYVHFALHCFNENVLSRPSSSCLRSYSGTFSQSRTSWRCCEGLKSFWRISLSLSIGTTKRSRCVLRTSVASYSVSSTKLASTLPESQTLQRLLFLGALLYWSKLRKEPHNLTCVNVVEVFLECHTSRSCWFPSSAFNSFCTTTKWKR